MALSWNKIKDQALKFANTLIEIKRINDIRTLYWQPRQKVQTR